jgi:hypothetical protein
MPANVLRNGMNQSSKRTRDPNSEKKRQKCIPSNPYCEGSLRPISPLDDGHLASHVAPGPVENLMGMPVVDCGASMVVGVCMSTIVGM